MTNYRKARYAELQWCRVARAKRREEVAYFGTLAPESTNDARAVWGMYR